MNPCHNYYCINSFFKVGTINDPHTGEPTEVFAHAKVPHIGYRKANGLSGDLSTPESDAAWPEQGIYDLFTANGRSFSELHTDKEGWWRVPDERYLPLTHGQGRWAGFFRCLGVGLSNGFPAWDVFMFSVDSLFPKRLRWWLWGRQAARRVNDPASNRYPAGQECDCETVV